MIATYGHPGDAADHPTVVINREAHTMSIRGTRDNHVLEPGSTPATKVEPIAVVM